MMKKKATCEIAHCNDPATAEITLWAYRQPRRDKIPWAVCGKHLGQIGTILLSMTPTIVERELIV